MKESPRLCPFLKLALFGQTRRILLSLMISLEYSPSSTCKWLLVCRLTQKSVQTKDKLKICRWYVMMTQKTAKLHSMASFETSTTLKAYTSWQGKKASTTYASMQSRSVIQSFSVSLRISCWSKSSLKSLWLAKHALSPANHSFF